MPERLKTQADMRRNYNNPDQHGRMWLITIEKETGDITGNVHPCGWNDPLQTPVKYMSVPPEARGRLHIDYDRWIADLKAREVERNRHRDAIGQAKFDAAYDPEDPHPWAEREAGPKPLDWRLVQRARDGDAEMLGLPVPEEEPDLKNRVVDTTPRDEFLATDPSWPQFVSWMAHNEGISDTKVLSPIWRDHQKTMSQVSA